VAAALLAGPAAAGQGGAPGSADEAAAEHSGAPRRDSISGDTIDAVGLRLERDERSVRAVVLVHGVLGHPDSFRGLEVALGEGGFVPVPVIWTPAPGEGARGAATASLLPAIEAGLRRAGLDPASAFFAVGHSAGGLLLRDLAARDATFAERLRALVMVSTPNRGARTGIARAGCDVLRRWRGVACDLVAGSAYLTALGDSAPPIPTLAIGVEAPAPSWPAPPWDGDGDGRARGHDDAVMAEAVRLDGAAFAVFRAWRRSDHFDVLCAGELQDWVVGFLREGAIPETPRRRLRGEAGCAESKAAWRARNEWAGPGRFGS
jgi:alpha-beta hydrolase superfamily lysophospholipase